LVNVFARMIIIDHPFPLQPLAGASWVPHPFENPAEILSLMVPPIGDVGQPRQWSGPLPRQRLLSWLGHPPQVYRPQPPSLPIVDRDGRRRPFPITRLATDRQHQPITTHGQHRLAATSRGMRLFQPREDLSHQSVMAVGLHPL